MPDIEKIRANVRRGMAHKGLNPHSLSELARLNETAVRDLLSRVTDPRLSTLEAIAGALDLSLEALLNGPVS